MKTVATSSCIEIDRRLPATEKIGSLFAAHLRVVSMQLDVATVFIREWRYLEGERRETFLAERRRYEERFRGLFREGRELGELRTDLDDATSTCSRSRLRTGPTPGCARAEDTDELADRFSRFSSTACVGTRRLRERRARLNAHVSAGTPRHLGSKLTFCSFPSPAITQRAAAAGMRIVQERGQLRCSIQR